MNRMLLFLLFNIIYGNIEAQTILKDSSGSEIFNFEIHNNNTYSYSVNGIFLNENILFNNLYPGLGFSIFSFKTKDGNNSEKYNASLLQYPYMLVGALLVLSSESSYNKENSLTKSLKILFWLPYSQLHYCLLCNSKSGEVLSIYIKSSIDYFFFQYNDYFTFYPGIGVSYNDPNYTIKIGYEKIISDYGSNDQNIFFSFGYKFNFTKARK